MLSKINYIPISLLFIFISKDVVWSVKVLSVLPGTKGFTVALVHPVSYRSCTKLVKTSFCL